MRLTNERGFSMNVCINCSNLDRPCEIASVFMSVAEKAVETAKRIDVALSLSIAITGCPDYAPILSEMELALVTGELDGLSIAPGVYKEE